MSRDASTALSAPASAKRPSGSSVVAMPIACRKARASAISAALTHVSRSTAHRYMIARAASSNGRDVFGVVITCAPPIDESQPRVKTQRDTRGIFSNPRLRIAHADMRP